MGFSAERHGEDGYYMEEDVLSSGDFEPQKHIRRISKTKKNKWILDKKGRDETESQFKQEHVFNSLMGNNKYPGLLDYFDTLTDKLTEDLYLFKSMHKSMKLKSILETLANEQLPQQAPQLQQDIVTVSQHPQAEASVVQRGLSKEQKKMLQGLVMEYNRFNEVLEARKHIMEVANKMSNIGDLSEAYLTEKLHEGNKDENAWFEEKTIRRNTSEIKKLTGDFKKMASDCDEQLRNMQTLYKECGMLLERYFNME
jgi:hypothetical protein